jgi:glucose/arabinose dehydrogenase
MRRAPLAGFVAALWLAGCGATAGTQPTPIAVTATAVPSAVPAASAPTAPTAPAPTIAAAAATAAPTIAPATDDERPPRVQLERVTEGLTRPVHITNAGDGSGRLFVVEKPGRIMIVRDGAVQPDPLLDITDRVGAQGSEQGLLSVAFHPRFAENGSFFVNYTDRRGDTVISRFRAEGDRADPTSEQVLLQVDQPYPNHNGGLVLFGPDGYLYIGMGDGGSAGDPQGYGQRMDTLLGKMLRIDVDNGNPYGIPPGNLQRAGARPEIWATGLRNPWRFSFDRATGDLFIGDVGQNAWEEIDWLPAGAPAGANFGWNVLEGEACYRNATCDRRGFVMPIATYGHDLGCSVTGGYVYRGAQSPGLQGAYIFGDYCSGQMWTLRPGTDGDWTLAPALDTNLSITSFGEDEAGELYLTAYEGELYRVRQG